MTWISQNILFPFNYVEQKALDHHLEVHAMSQVAYSLSYFVRLYGKVLSVIRAIQSEQYSHDMNAVARVAVLAGALDETPVRGPALPSEQAPRSESEISSSISVASTDGQLEA